MSGVPSGEYFDTSKYQNPHQDWVCGHHRDGEPCPIGPNGSGECLVARICVPEHDGDVWHCTRARVWGGRCTDGPIPDPDCPDQKATCPHQPVPCQPERSLRNKRRLVTGLTAAAALGCCLLILGGSSGSPDRVLNASAAIISPGPLTAHHATMDQGCAACHSAASESPLDLLSCAFGGKGGLQESQKCLECHKEFGDHALFPHSLNPVDMSRETERADGRHLPGSHTLQQRLARMVSTHNTTESGELACSTCHQEHQGAEHDLTLLTNAQCQSCHSSSFHSFTVGHPEFPTRKRAYIYFDHSTHLQTHFQKHSDSSDPLSQILKCGDCHVQDATGTSMILNRFENTCAKCHVGQIADDHMPLDLRMPGAAFLSLNLAEVRGAAAAVDEDGASVLSGWPAAGSNSGDQQNRFESLLPFMEIMLLSDEGAVVALQTLRSAEASQTQVSAARSAFASSIQQLVADLVTDREIAVTRRLLAVVAPDHPARDQVETVAERLAESGFFAVLAVAQSQWFPDWNGPVTATSDAAAPDAANVAGAWGIADRLTLRYRSRGHADPLLRDWLSFAAMASSKYPSTPAKDSTGAFDRLFHRLAEPEAPGHCMKCHTADTLPGGGLRINWNSRQVLPTASEFTKFAHGPHVTLLSSEKQAEAMGSTTDTRCQTCHSLQDREPILRMAEFLLDDWMPNPDFNHPSSIGLNSVQRASCVNCHTHDLAGESCLQCHNYHVHAATLNER